MGILDRLLPQATKANRAQALVDTSIGMGTVSPRYKDYHSYLSAYKSPWVKACVSVIAYNGANVKYKLLSGDEEDPVEILSSPLLNLLARPNPMQTGFQLLESILIDQELTGNCYITLEEQDGRGRPAEMYRLSPDCVTVLPDPVKMVAGYVYTVNGKAIKYLPEELLHLKSPNPLSDLYGMGTIEAGEARFDSELAMAEHERQFWRNGAKITGVLTTDGAVDDKVFTRLRDNIRNFFRGSGYSTLMLENGLKYQSVSDGPAKLGLIEMSKASRDMILAMFGVPPTKLGILENANYKAQASDEFFWTETIDPKLTRLEQELQRLVEVFHPNAGYRLAFDRLNFSDDLPTATVAKLLHETNSMTINELREYRGAEGIGKAGDTIMIQDNWVPLKRVLDGQVVPPRAPQALALTPEQIAANRDEIKLLRVQKAGPAAALTVTRHVAAALTDAERTKTARIAAAFAAQERAVLAALAPYKRRKSQLDVLGLFPDEGDDYGGAEEELSAALYGTQLAAAEAAYGTAGALGIDATFDLHNPRLEEFVGQLAGRVTGINDTTKGALDEQINEGLRRGYSVDQIARGVPGEGYKGIAGVFADAKGYRATMIARTETMNAYNGAALLAYGESGVVRAVEMLDGNQDPQCAARNGQVVSVDEARGIGDHPNGTLTFIPLIA